jgi:hypothetical protein
VISVALIGQSVAAEVDIRDVERVGSSRPRQVAA